MMGLVGMEPTDAIITVNIDASPYGLVVRPGYKEYINGFTGDAAKTIIPFTGSADGGSNDKFFSTTNDGIFDISDEAGIPLKVFNYLDKATTAGWGIFTQVVNDNGDHALLLTDSENGVFQYLESTGLWGIPDITGPTGVLVFVTKWKERVWYIEKDSTSAWYTDPGSFSGALTEFNFGNKFRSGGNLVALYSWTLDAGDGSDDYLVAVSSAGDVVVYSGTDPDSSSTFGQIGRWFIGALPAGRRVGSQFGGDLLLLSSYGLISAGDLLAGNNPFTEKGSLSWKIQGFLSSLMAETRTTLGWEVKLHPSLNIVMISTPKVVNKPFRQFVYNTNVEGWSIWEDVPILTSESFKGKAYFASPNPSSVWFMHGYLDNVRITPQEQAGIFLFGYTYGVGSPAFQVGDRITGQTSGASATVYSVGDDFLGVASVTGTFIVGEVIDGPQDLIPYLLCTASVTGGGTTDSIATSFDGETFVGRTVTVNTKYVAAAYSSSRAEVLVLSSVGGIQRSTDGEIFTPLTSNIGNGNWRDITWAEDLGLYVAGGDGITTDHKISTSPDGVDWTPRDTSARSGNLQKVFWDHVNKKLLAGFSVSSTQPALISTDGIAWSLISPAGFSYGVYEAAVADNGRLMTANRGDFNTVYTDDYVNFTLVTIIGGTESLGYSPSSNLFVLGNGSGLYSSPVGTPAWTQRESTLHFRDCEDIIWSDAFSKFAGIRPISGSETNTWLLSAPAGTSWVATNMDSGLANTSTWSRILEAFFLDFATATLDSIAVNPTEGLPREIEWRGLTAYSDLGSPEKMKRMSFIRPVFISDTVPTFSAVAKYEYDLQELDDFLNLQTIGDSLWDQALWDNALWDGSPESRLLPPRGASGMGRVVAISWAGKSHAKTTLASFGVGFDSGGMM